MGLLIVICAILLLLVLMLIFKLNAFIALILVSFAVGITQGMPLATTLGSVTKGVGGTLGSLALVLAFGAMLGKVIEESGAAHRITYSLIKLFGKKNIQWAIVITGFLVGLPMVYNAGFLVLIPLIYAISRTADVSLLYVGIPMAASLSTTHGLLPPHPAPTAISVLYKADVNVTLLYGVLIAIPAVILAGPVLSKFFTKWKVTPPQNLYEERNIPENEWPGLGISLLVALLPVLLMLSAAVVSIFLPKDAGAIKLFNFLGDPNIALLLAVLTGVYLLGVRKGKKMDDLMKSLSASVGSIAMIVLIIASGGAFKQVLLDSGIGEDIKGLMMTVSFSPIILAWVIAAVLRLALGSATVSAITAAGMVQPMLANAGVSPELMVLATSSGSLMFSHVNDIGFWMFKEYFNVSLKQTFLVWSVMETIVAVVGLLGVLLLNTIL